MSYDLGLYYGRTPATVARHTEGGTYAAGGITNAELNVTYNYTNHFHEMLDAEQGIRWLYGKTGQETRERLRAAVEQLGVERHDDYWKSTPGNAGYALSILLAWAEQHPNAVWNGD